MAPQRAQQNSREQQALAEKEIKEIVCAPLGTTSSNRTNLCLSEEIVDDEETSEDENEETPSYEPNFDLLTPSEDDSENEALQDIIRELGADE